MTQTRGISLRTTVMRKDKTNTYSLNPLFSKGLNFCSYIKNTWRGSFKVKNQLMKAHSSVDIYTLSCNQMLSLYKNTNSLVSFPFKKLNLIFWNKTTRLLWIFTIKSVYPFSSFCSHNPLCTYKFHTYIITNA